MRSTHTFAELEISDAAYREIEALLKTAGYDHVFVRGSEAPTMDMHGIGLVPKSRSDYRSETDAQVMNEVALGHRKPVRGLFDAMYPDGLPAGSIVLPRRRPGESVNDFMVRADGHGSTDRAERFPLAPSSENE